jgi:superfamily I DNA/RNA helicase
MIRDGLCRQISRNDPEISEIERRVTKLKLLDEYQDTSYPLWCALLLNGHAVMAVGDPNQAILWVAGLALKPWELLPPILWW